MVHITGIRYGTQIILVHHLCPNLKTNRQENKSNAYKKHYFLSLINILLENVIDIKNIYLGSIKSHSSRCIESGQKIECYKL